MREFFHGWRRKAGCVLLLMACLFQLALLRCCFVEDVIRYDFNSADYVEIRFEDGAVVCGYWWNKWIDAGMAPLPDEFNWVTFPKKDRKTHRTLFDYYDSSSTVGSRASGHVRLRVPDLPAVVILTALAAYLLLRKPRSASQSHA